jgi:uncharacterized membrane protein (UPF0127 family)
MKYYKARHLIFIIPILFLCVSFIFFQMNKNVKPSSSEGSFIKLGGEIIRVELALTREEQIQGLSDRESLCPDCGMLFIFPERQVRSFWMKNMLFSIDIVWIDNNKIVKIDRDLQPEGEKPEHNYSSIMPVDTVLELNAGYCDLHNIKEGDRVEKNL